MCYWLHGAPPPEQGGRFGVPQGSFPSPSCSRRSPGRPCDPGFCSRTAHKNLAFLLGPKPSSQRRPFSRIASGWLEAAAAAPGGDLAVRGGRGQPAFVSCFARGFWGKSRGTQSPAFAWAPWAGWLRLPLCAPQAASSLAGLRTLGCARPRAKSVNTCWGERLPLQRPFLCPAVMGLMFRGCQLPEYVFPGMRSLLLAERTVKIRKESSKVSWDRSRYCGGWRGRNLVPEVPLERERFAVIPPWKHQMNPNWAQSPWARGCKAVAKPGSLGRAF